MKLKARNLYRNIAGKHGQYIPSIIPMYDIEVPERVAREYENVTEKTRNARRRLPRASVVEMPRVAPQLKHERKEPPWRQVDYPCPVCGSMWLRNGKCNRCKK